MGENEGRAVLITGVSTGIGRGVALALAAEGYRVFGGVRREEDADDLARVGVEPLLLDVTSEEQIAGARVALEASLGDAGLFALVNNAGVVAGGPVELVPLDELRRVFEVNVFGVYALTQALLPMLRAARGRVVNISSVSGLLAAPFLSPYAGSKFALEAISDSLRRELAPLGCAVSVIEPGPIRTPIWGKATLPPEDAVAGSPYVEGIARAKERVRQSEASGLPVEAVARVASRVLAARRPPTRTIVARGALTYRILRLLPDRFLDRIAR